MATIVGGIATSHTPTIGFALDTNKQQDAVWAPIFAGYQPVQRWLAEKQPDVLFFIFNDHITSFFFDHYSHFALGVTKRGLCDKVFGCLAFVHDAHGERNQKAQKQNGSNRCGRHCAVAELGSSPAPRKYRHRDRNRPYCRPAF